MAKKIDCENANHGPEEKNVERCCDNVAEPTYNKRGAAGCPAESGLYRMDNKQISRPVKSRRRLRLVYCLVYLSSLVEQGKQRRRQRSRVVLNPKLTIISPACGALLATCGPNELEVTVALRVGRAMGVPGGRILEMQLRTDLGGRSRLFSRGAEDGWPLRAENETRLHGRQGDRDGLGVCVAFWKAMWTALQCSKDAPCSVVF
ncbi:hypothetical protein RirG_031870 [Rhizophagus irregularis DAOM 197198w]|uniref:Uncharacterized protein n=1 Tax=Rhizophagus irregularis (strain DAOM 197198w) TaxID=1432141 RepID=A0A015LV65_RHIIW|nr:hypothetical protein RirG_031870 [Rhizophagus irregularis DAOM 197198w]